MVVVISLLTVMNCKLVSIPIRFYMALLPVNNNCSNRKGDIRFVVVVLYAMHKKHVSKKINEMFSKQV